MLFSGRWLFLLSHLRFTSFIILHVSLSPTATFCLPLFKRLTAYCWSVKCVGANVQCNMNGYKQPPLHPLWAWGISRVSQVSWELFLDDPTLFCFTKPHVKEERSSQTIWERKEGGREEKEDWCLGKAHSTPPLFWMECFGQPGTGFLCSPWNCRSGTLDCFGWVVAFVVSVTAVLMNASIDHCHPGTTSKQTYF